MDKQQINKMCKHTKQLTSQQMNTPTNNQSKNKQMNIPHEWTNNPMNGNKYVQIQKMNVYKLFKAYLMLLAQLIFYAWSAENPET